MNGVNLYLGKEASLGALSITFAFRLFTGLAVAGPIPADCANPPGAPAPRNAIFSSRVLAATGIPRPSALAYGPRGELYIADPRGNRILMLRAEGRLLPLAASQRRGYVDGSLSVARFNSPSGLAITRDGAIYVADVGNHAIRLIDPRGYVRTIARSQALRPTALALDDLDNLYVADAAKGVLKSDADGRLQRIAVDVRKPKSIAASGLGKFSTLFISSDDGLTVFHSWNAQALLFPVSYRTGPAIEHLQGFRRIGHPYALAAIDDHTLFYTDREDGSIRYIDTDENLGRIVAFKPGVLDQPLSITLKDGRDVVVGVQGGIILRLTNLDLRKPAFPGGLQGWLMPKLPSSDSNPSVAIIGTSMLWWNTDWPDSIPGQMQSALTNRVSVHPIVIPDGTVEASEDYLANVSETQQIDIALLQVSAVMLARSYHVDAAELERRASEWKPAFARGLAQLKQKLDARHVRLIVVAQPQDFELSSATSSSLEGEVVDASRAAGVSVIDLYPPFMKAFSQGVQLFGVCDKHPQSAGRALAGQQIAQYLQQFLPLVSH